jgi:L-threonylcarbamoyladenylate synthase
MRVDMADTIARVAHGQALCFPTDTVPALAARLDCTAQIYQIKRRSPDKPLILMAADVAGLQPYIDGWEPDWERLMKVAWPGQLTLVLPATSRVPAAMIAGGHTVGVRIPNLATALQLLAQTGPLATTSVNRSGEAPLTTPEAIAAAFPELPVLDVPFPTGTAPSTVAKWLPQGGWDVLRQGAFRLPPSSPDI